MKKLMTSALFAAAMTTSATAATYTLDFDANPGASVAEIATLDASTSQTPESPRVIWDGLRWRVTAGGGGVALFDTTCSGYGVDCNGDADLVPSVSNAGNISGNVLIQQTDDIRENRTPNDDRNTQLIELTLLDDVKLVWTGISATDDGRYRFKTRINGVESGFLGQIDIDADSKSASTTFMSNVLGINDSLIIVFSSRGSNTGGDSGGVDNLTFNVVPVPAGLPLLLGGLGIFAFIKRRKHA